ncbi:MAG TPA: hypothetical protein VM324_12630 [Egibacteraceae bacterium]|nr:hypothetical protein [Egibacteraceae bacterium]
MSTLPPEGPAFDPLSILAALEAHGVAYVLIGAFAATIHGSPLATADADITPARDEANLHRLSEALRAMGARVWAAGEPQGLAFDCSGEALARADIWNLVTDHGRVDISFAPAGTRGYDDLVVDAAQFDIAGVAVRVASLADVIRSKEAAGREKDRAALPILRRLLDELRRRDAQGGR